MRAEWKNIFISCPHGANTAEDAERTESELIDFAGRMHVPIGVLILLGPQSLVPDPECRSAIQRFLKNPTANVGACVVLVHAKGFLGSALLSVGSTILDALEARTSVVQSPLSAAKRLIERVAPEHTTAVELTGIIDELCETDFAPKGSPASQDYDSYGPRN